MKSAHCLDSQAGLRDFLGLPLKRPDKSSNEEPVQYFENGVITLRDGIPQGWIPAAILLGPSPQDIDLLNVDCSAVAVTPGQTVSLEYTIRSRLDRRTLVALGASLIAADGKEYFDRATGRHVNLSPGEATYHRRLQVPPDTPQGNYRLVGAAWYPSIGSQRLARTDSAIPVTVGPPDQRFDKS